MLIYKSLLVRLLAIFWANFCYSDSHLADVIGIFTIGFQLVMVKPLFIKTFDYPKSLL
jgi:hypothetical protein